MNNKAKYEFYRIIADKLGVTDYKVAKDTGIAQETLSSWKKGKYVPKMDKLEKIADYFDVPIDYFFEKESDTNISRFIYEVAAGNGRINDGCYTEESTDTIRDYSYVRICGDSMYPSLHDGDVVKVHHVTDDITPSDFAIVKVNGDESTCKHIEITKDGIWLRAENKEVFEDTFYSVQDVLTLPVTIIGKAIAITERKL